MKPNIDASALSGVKLKSTNTRIRTRDGKLFEERKSVDGTLVATLIGKEVLPPLLQDGEACSRSLPAWRWEGQSWVREDATTTAKNVPARFRIVSYNVWFKEWHQEARALALLELLHEPAIACFQEVTPSFLRILLATDWVRQHYFVSDGPVALTVNPYGVVMIVRKNVFPHVEFRISNFPSNQGRRLLTAHLGPSLVVGTVHLESLDNAEMRIAQLTTAKQQCTLVCGDMNFADGEAEEQCMADGWTDVGKGGSGTASDGLFGRYDRFFLKNGLVGSEYQTLGESKIGGDLPTRPR